MLIFFSVPLYCSFHNFYVLLVQSSMDYFCFLQVWKMSSFIYMYHHGVGSSVVFADPGVKTMTRFTKSCLTASTAGYAVYRPVRVVYGLLSAMYYVMYLFTGCAGEFHCTVKVSAKCLGNVTWG